MSDDRITKMRRSAPVWVTAFTENPVIVFIAGVCCGIVILHLAIISGH